MVAANISTIAADTIIMAAVAGVVADAVVVVVDTRTLAVADVEVEEAIKTTAVIVVSHKVSEGVMAGTTTVGTVVVASAEIAGAASEEEILEAGTEETVVADIEEIVAVGAAIEVDQVIMVETVVSEVEGFEMDRCRAMRCAPSAKIHIQVVVNGTNRTLEGQDVIAGRDSITMARVVVTFKEGEAIKETIEMIT
jgi:hypothetical protein